MSDTFSARLRALHQRVLNPETGKPYTQRMVVQALQDSGYTVSLAYFNQLFNGTRDKPSFEVVQGLARFYGVKADYFDLTDQSSYLATLQQLDLLHFVKDGRFRAFMARAGHAGEPDGRQHLVQALIEAMDEAERESRENSQGGDENSSGAPS